MRGILLETGDLFDGWEVIEMLGEGKSASVYLCSKDSTTAAIKIYNHEIVKKYGLESHEDRISRQLKIQEDGHANLVKVLGGGEHDGRTYLAMEHVRGSTVKDSLQAIRAAEDFPYNAWKIICQVADAARHLESIGICHRDIKPENIILTPEGNAVLLDLGVIKPINETSHTDSEAPLFIGTLRYSSPEYLFREEDGSKEGWRALTFYQLGATLYDMLTGEEIFKAQSHPYARLVDAIKHTPAAIPEAGLPHFFSMTLRNCLAKDPSLRLKALNWDHFTPDACKEKDSLESIKERILNIAENMPHQITTEDSHNEKRLLKAVSSIIISCVQTEKESSPILPSVKFDSEKYNRGSPLVLNQLTSSDKKIGLRHNISSRYEISLESQVDSAISIIASHENEKGLISAPKKIFIGPINQSEISKHVIQCLYCAIEIAIAKEK